MAMTKQRQTLTLRVQHLGDVKVFLSHFKSIVQVGDRVVLGKQVGKQEELYQEQS